jgi:hypothetical protein
VFALSHGSRYALRYGEVTCKPIARCLTSLTEILVIGIKVAPWQQDELFGFVGMLVCFYLREALDHLESLNKESSDAWQPYEHRSLLGFSLMAQKKFAEAEPWLLSGYQGLLRRRAMIPQENLSFLEQAGERLVQFYKDWGKPDKVMEWSHKLQVARSGAGAEPH